MKQLIINPGATYSGHGREIDPPYINGQPAYAAYALGTDYDPYQPGRDISGNGRHVAALPGAAFGPSSVTVGPGAFLTCPFSGADLMSRLGACSFGAFVVVPAAANHPVIGNYQGNAAGSPASLQGYLGGGGGDFSDSFVTQTSQILGPPEPARGGGFEMYLWTFSSLVQGFYRMTSASGLLLAGSRGPAEVPTGGPGAMRIGATYKDGDFGNTVAAQHALDFFYDQDVSLVGGATGGASSIVGIQAIFNWGRAELAKEGIAV